MDKLRAIEVFIAISKHGSLTQAAESLGKSLPTVVRTLALLEEDIGFRLFNRSTRRVALTEEGEIYLDHCADFMRDLCLVENKLAGHDGTLEGRVHITSPVVFGEKYVMPAILDLYQSNPKLNVRLLSDDKVVDLVKEQIDIAVRIGHLQDSSLHARHVGKVRKVLCASEECLEQYGLPQTPADLADKPCIQINAKDAGMLWSFQKQGSPVTVSIKGAMICNMVKPAIQACVNGLGFGLFFEYQVYEEVKAGKLRIVLEDFELPEFPIHLIYPHAKLLPPRVKGVIKDLSDSIRGHLGVTRVGG